MNIKKVDEKPIVVHTKAKTVIHTQGKKEARIKGNNIYSVSRGPKAIESAIHSKKLKMKIPSDYVRNKNKKTFRKSTVHQNNNGKEKNGIKCKSSIKQSKSSVKNLKTSIHVGGYYGSKAISEQMEGGREVREAAIVAYGAVRPVIGTASKSARLFKQQAFKEKRKNKSFHLKRRASSVKTTNPVKKKQDRMRTSFKNSRKSVSERMKDRKSSNEKGSSVRIAQSFRETNTEKTNIFGKNQSRRKQYFLNKVKSQKSGMLTFNKEILKKGALILIKKIVSMLGAALGSVALLIAIAAVPAIIVIAILYNSPFAIVLPPIEAGDTVQTITKEYVDEFNEEVTRICEEHRGCDKGEIVYVDYEGMAANPSNYSDILAVYMVKKGIGETATIINDTSKGWIKEIVTTMCSYTTSTGSKTTTDDDGKEHTTTYLYVNVTLKSYRDMIAEYGFHSYQVEMLEELMNPDFMAQFGSDGISGGIASGIGSGGSPGVSSLAQNEINDILKNITDPTLRKVCAYALSKVGYGYSQNLRDSGNYFDCSSLMYYAWKAAGVDISHGGATTAAAEGQGLDEAEKTVSYDELQPGDLIFYSYANNGRYLNISHVAIYVGNGKIVEARGEAYGVVYRDVPNEGSIALIGRPE